MIELQSLYDGGQGNFFLAEMSLPNIRNYLTTEAVPFTANQVLQQLGYLMRMTDLGAQGFFKRRGGQLDLINIEP